jgi:hypothetical protein
VRTIIQKISIRSIDAKKFIKGGERMQNVKITNSSSVTSMHLEEDVLVLEYVFAVDYFPNIASIKIEGEIRYVGDITGVDVNDKSTLTPEISRESHTAILRFCLPELVIISKQLELVPPIPIPSIEKKNSAGNEKIKDNIYDYR